MRSVLVFALWDYSRYSRVARLKQTPDEWGAMFGIQRRRTKQQAKNLLEPLVRSLQQGLKYQELPPSRMWNHAYVWGFISGAVTVIAEVNKQTEAVTAEIFIELIAELAEIEVSYAWDRFKLHVERDMPDLKKGKAASECLLSQVLFGVHDDTNPAVQAAKELASKPKKPVSLGPLNSRLFTASNPSEELASALGQVVWYNAVTERVRIDLRRC